MDGAGDGRASASLRRAVIVKSMVEVFISRGDFELLWFGFSGY